MTPDWVTTAMRSAGVLETDARVTAVEAAARGRLAMSMTGELHRLQLTYERRSAGPPTVIAKFASSNGQIKGMLEHTDAYGREIMFYRDLAPLMPVRTPRHYGSALDVAKSKDRPAVARVIDALPARVQLLMTKDVSKFMRATKRRYVLLIEDFGATSTVYDAIEPPPIAMIEVALDAMAELHASFWGGGSLGDHPALGHLVTRIPKLYRNEVRHRTLELAQRHWSEWWTSDDTEVALASADRLARDVAKVNEPWTLVHGDPRSDNLLFLGDDGPVFIDWALQCMAHPGWDLSVLLGSSLREEDVDAVDDLIAGYHAALTSHGAAIAADELRGGFQAGLRTQAVQEVLSVRVLPATYREGVALHDLWMPRILALLRREQTGG